MPRMTKSVHLKPSMKEQRHAHFNQEDRPVHQREIWDQNHFHEVSMEIECGGLNDFLHAIQMLAMRDA